MPKNPKPKPKGKKTTKGTRGCCKGCKKGGPCEMKSKHSVNKLIKNVTN